MQPAALSQDHVDELLDLIVESAGLDLSAVNYQQTVLKAWQEIDDALSAYVAEQQQVQQLELRVRSAGDAYQLAQARYEGGAADFIAVLDSQRSYLQARRDLAASEGRMSTSYVTINKVIGNAPLNAESPAEVSLK